MKRASFVSIFFPMVLSFVTGRLIIQTDLLMLSRLGPGATAAFGIPGRVLFLDFVLSLAMTPIVSVAVAESKDENERRRALQNVISLSALTALALTLFGLMAYFPFVSYLAPNAEVAVLAKQALLWMILATPFRFVEVVGSVAVYALGKGRQLVVLDVVQLVLNAGLNYALIYGLKMGFAGSYLGTSLISMVGAMTVLHLLSDGNGILSLFKVPSFDWSCSVLKKVSIEGIRLGSAQLVNLIALSMLSRSDSVDPMSAFAVQTAFQSLLFMPVIAVMRSTAIWAPTSGCGLRRLAVQGSLLAVLGSLTLLCLGKWIGVNAYGFSASTMYWWWPFYVIVACSIPLKYLDAIQRGVLQSQKKFSTILKADAFAQWALLLPILFLGLRYANPWFAWSSYAIADLAAAAVLFIPGRRVLSS